VLPLPLRYQLQTRLGQGAGGEVWAVRDRASNRLLAVKVIAFMASDAEGLALVRETMALSGLQGLGLPEIVAFGTLADGRRYMVRELIEGHSLEAVLADPSLPTPWPQPLVDICDQLTTLHRAGILHGDIKPANIIVGGRNTLVDFGLAAPWREQGTVPSGLTPKYAAPELLAGECLTVRAEVYALGATLAETLTRRGAELDATLRLSLEAIAAHAMAPVPSQRPPSVDEIASDLRQAMRLSPRTTRSDSWPVVGLEATAQDLLVRALALGNGEALAIEGPKGSGKTTLLHRLAWTLGIAGHAVARLDASSATVQLVELELSEHPAFVVLDDVALFDQDCLELLRSASHLRILGAGTRNEVGLCSASRVASFPVPPLDARWADDLMQRAIPSLSEAMRAHLFAASGGYPGPLRATLRQLAHRPVVSIEDLDMSLAGCPPPPSRDNALRTIEQALDMGHFEEASALLAGQDSVRAEDSTLVRVAVARARLSLGRGDATEAENALATVEGLAPRTALFRVWLVTRARASLRVGDHAHAITLADSALAACDGDASDPVASDALSVRGVALALTGQDPAALESLASAVGLAKQLGDTRQEAVALGSLAFAHQRAGRTAEARIAYQGSLAAAEKARDAATVAAMRLNLAGLAQAEGDLAGALAELEAAVDLGERAGGILAVQQARLNLATLDVYLGRYARAAASMASMQPERLAPNLRAQLAGIQAELASRTGDEARGAKLYEQAAQAWEALGRRHDAIEARLEGLLVRANGTHHEDHSTLARELASIESQQDKAAGFGEHAPLASLVTAAIARRSGDEAAARRALDCAVAEAERCHRHEWEWQARDARSRLAAAQGSLALARRDTEAALAILEEAAASLPRDLREVFWNEPRRRAIRQAPQWTADFTAPRTEDKLRRVLELTRDLAREHDMERLLGRVTEHALALLGGERGFVLLGDESGKLSPHAARSRKGDEPHAQFSHSVAQQVLTTGEPVLAVNACDDVRLAQAVSVHQLSIQSVACVPIRGAPPLCKTIGALYVETGAGRRFQEELPTLLAFADQAAIAIENARLLDENRLRAEELTRTNAELAVARDRLAALVGMRTEQLAEARRDLKQVRAELRGHFGYAGLVGTSAPMRRLYALIERIKETDIPVLISGESGTGKEVVAKAIHGTGPRAKKPFVGVNCGAIPAQLLESELFGCVRGAFTGADRDRKGLFREADGGTLLLDEIGEMPQKMQAGLLRVLQEHEVRPVGGTKEVAIDVRVLAATNRNLTQMVADGTFREDLYYRLAVVELRLPSLRERLEDLTPLIDHFLTIFASRYRRERRGIARSALRKLAAYPWPGNVRQLEHVLLSAWLMSDAEELQPDDLELPVVAPPRQEPAPRPTETSVTPPGSEAEFRCSERERILSALAECNWNKVKAAQKVGLARRTFYRRLKEFGIL
jgi:transcriptional regulator with GAF, ATPase, and Fis domain